MRWNPKIDVSVVDAHERPERKLEKISVEIQPRYNIEPPFGSRPRRLYNHDRSLIPQTEDEVE